MKKLALALGLALAAAMPVHGATPEDLGAINSPADFLQTCNAASVLAQDLPAAKDAGESLPGDAAEMAEAVVLVSREYCSAVIQAVAETVMQDPDYRINGKARICIDPETPFTEVLDTAQQLYDRGGAPTKQTTPRFLLYVFMHRHMMSGSRCE